MLTSFLLIIPAYLIGAIPTAVIAGKLFHGIDIREHGSKNAGATNTVRVLGPQTGIPVLLFDILKGFAVTQLYLIPSGDLPLSELDFRLILGLCAVLGHLFPIFASFKGGKGIATLLGVFIGIHTISALCILGLFVLIFSISRIVSLGSITCGVIYPFLTFFIFNIKEPVFNGFTVFFALLILITHKQNIERLLNGQEKKLKFNNEPEQ